MSSRPLRISVGTLGIGAVLGGTNRPAGHRRHCSSALTRATSPRLNGPNRGSGAFASASVIRGGRSSSGDVSG
jgi:hypothetical protein